MYKQYLASLHKLGKRDVISAQHYAACVRTVFGGSVGPNQRTLQNGKVSHDLPITTCVVTQHVFLIFILKSNLLLIG